MEDVFEHTIKYIVRRGYQVVDTKPNLVFTKKTIIDEHGRVAELWLSISVLGEHYITVFMDYQLRSQEPGDGVDYRGILVEIENEYEGLWHKLRELK
ncbi:MAG: hypothetical protein QW429_04440 [Thermoprotei archaeon]